MATFDVLTDVIVAKQALSTADLTPEALKEVMTNVIVAEQALGAADIAPEALKEVMINMQQLNRHSALQTLHLKH